jgi:hypothetical protein
MVFLLACAIQPGHQLGQRMVSVDETSYATTSSTAAIRAKVAGRGRRLPFSHRETH